MDEQSPGDIVLSHLLDAQAELRRIQISVERDLEDVAKMIDRHKQGKPYVPTVPDAVMDQAWRLIN